MEFKQLSDLRGKQASMHMSAVMRNMLGLGKGHRRPDLRKPLFPLCCNADISAERACCMHQREWTEMLQSIQQRTNASNEMEQTLQKVPIMV